ncbi:MAG: dipeptide/oligopeptide/nickel ABC transporter permease/ATP-binding protein [bacterium]|nr:dipeptide/oligopeptide/nickel ABC transporter permease/ATP-binding protein [bacterium]
MNFLGRLPASGRVGLVLLAGALFVALTAPYLAAFDPYSTDLATFGVVFAPPDASHWLGTDDGGRDVLSALLHGTRVSLFVGACAAAIALFLGSAVGLLAGSMGGRVEALLMRATVGFLVIPELPLMIVAVALVDAGIRGTVLAIGLLGWTTTARLVRAQALTLRHRLYVRRARSQGAGPLRIVGLYILPGVLPVLLAQAVLVLSLAILNESTLSFLGLGDPTYLSWGQMLNLAFTRGAMSAGAWWAILPPGLAIAAVVLAASLVGRGLEAAWSTRPSGHHLMAGAAGADPQPRAGTALLEVRGLSVDYAGGVRALEDVDLQLQRGEILGVVGESGSGKSTLLLALMRLLPAGSRLSGSMHLDDVDLATLTEEAVAERRWRDLAVVFQGAMNALNPLQTVGAQIAEAVRRRLPAGDLDIDAQVAALLRRVGLDAERAADHPHQFSGGMRQRVLLAMALAGRARILLADEPTTALDVLSQARLLDLLQGLRDELGLTIILVTHDLGVIRRLCDRAVVLYGGRVAESAPVATLFATPQHPYTQGLLAAFPDLRQPERAPQSIPGTPVPLDPPPPGCRFAARCPRAEARCHGQTPALQSLGEHHYAACLLLEGVTQ